MPPDDPASAFTGTWFSAAPAHSDDYLVEYTITTRDGNPEVTARDYRDDEAMEISDVQFDGRTLQFASLMPSTGRRGLNRFTVQDHDRLQAEFTFTELDLLRRTSPVDPAPSDVWLGKWSRPDPLAEGDSIVDLTVTKSKDRYEVTARDSQDGERFEISDLRFDGRRLEFVSLMPSTARRGFQRLSVNDADTLNSEFTYQVSETLQRATPAQVATRDAWLRGEGPAPGYATP